MTTTLEALRWKKFPVLNDGFVCLVDVMGDDSSIVQAARVSYGKDEREEASAGESLREDRHLIRYLMRHRHTTPFEMAEVKLLVRVPMDCWRQWIRHRTANVNEYSTRYTEAIDSQQETTCGEWRLQATTNKQGSAGILIDWPEGWDAWVHQNEFNITGPGERRWCFRVGSEETKGWCREKGPLPGQFLTWLEKNRGASATEQYRIRLSLGVAKEQARKDLPLSTYTEAYWKCDLHNILHFLGLRMDSHAQQEIREYATIIGEQIIKPLFPTVWEAFEDYRLGGLFLSAIEQQALIQVFEYTGEAMTSREATEYLKSTICLNLPNDWRNDRCRERDEFLQKLKKIGLLVD